MDERGKGRLKFYAGFMRGEKAVEDESFEEVVKSAQEAAVLVLVY